MSWTVNTSNLGKINEYRRFLGSDTIFSSADLEEPDADLDQIVQYKASQFDNVIVDDVALDIEGQNIGVNIRWRLKELNLWIGRKSIFHCSLAVQRAGSIYLFKGSIEGKLVEPRGESFGFNPYFKPLEFDKTFGEEIPDTLNPRFLACQKLLAWKQDKVLPLLKDWVGKFQHEF